MPGFLGTLLDNYRLHLEQQRQRPFLEGCMAACAMVAVDDGDVSFAERIRVDQILETLDQLKVFDPHEGVDLFNDYVEAILADPEEGRARALADVEEAASESAETAALLVRVCCAISEADGTMKLVDQIEIVTLCSHLNLDPTAFGLYKDGTFPSGT